MENSIENKALFFFVVIGFSLKVTFLFSQNPIEDHDMKRKIELAAANPIDHNILGIPINLVSNYNIGEYNRNQMLFNITPTIPFNISHKVYVLARTVIPFVKQPVAAPSGNTYGVGNTNLGFYICPPTFGDLAIGFGSGFIIPTSSSEELGSDDFGVGPAFTAIWTSNNFLAGILFNQIWSYKTSNLNHLLGQYFLSYSFNNGWFINSTPTVNANFNASKGEQWTVPVGMGGGKIVHFPHIPIKFQMNGYYNIINPTNNADYSVHFTVTFLFSKYCH